MILASGANQGSIYHWARDHRTHHKYSDTDGDPHNSQNGFWYSHIGWLLVKKSPKVIWAGKKIDVSDLQLDPVVMFQKRWYAPLAIFFCFIFPAVFMCYTFDERLFITLSISFLRYCALLNAGWCVNSVAHFLGTRPYRPNIPPAENAFVSAITAGEGWHNYHHTYPRDYSTSEFGALGQYNPSKLFIDCFAAIGWVWDRKRF
uniref:Fatty acid desaturase n=1 Tax=Marseillevirus LCMAC101 TaxID=2506602 RepID=A0A481YQS0_9VIRU|nr:MAG: fatty acid desaturase [Marseillevirus LCMAC101]